MLRCQIRECLIKVIFYHHYHQRAFKGVAKDRLKCYKYILVLFVMISYSRKGCYWWFPLLQLDCEQWMNWKRWQTVGPSLLFKSSKYFPTKFSRFLEIVAPTTHIDTILWNEFLHIVSWPVEYEPLWPQWWCQPWGQIPSHNIGKHIKYHNFHVSYIDRAFNKMPNGFFKSGNKKMSSGFLPGKLFEAPVAGSQQ